MRLLEKEVEIIQQLFKELFLPNDHLWLFGSRVDDSKRGGDIDLYTQTHYDLQTAYNKKFEFLGRLQEKIGEQKIDFVIHILSSSTVLPIYEVAQKTGVRLV